MADTVTTDIVALIFDFDDTLVPDSKSKLLKEHGIDPAEFWQVQARKLIDQGYDPPAAYLKLLLDNVGQGEKLGDLTNAKLRQFGRSLDDDFYPGIPEFFDEIEADVRANYKNIVVEFYIISGGLYEIAKGSKISDRFKAIYGCHLAGDTEDGVLKYVKRSITFTEKTRYIFEIHKGVKPEESLRNPELVNKFYAPEQRRIPLKNMIYVGDGLTDIPCFSLIKKNGGIPFGVFDPKSEKKTKQALEEFLQTDRVLGMHAPDYSRGHELGMMLRVAVANKCSEIQLDRLQPRRTPL